MLTAELPQLRSLLPSGFSIPGLSSVLPQASQVREKVRPKASRWLVPTIVVGVLLLIGLVWFLNRGNTLNQAVSTATRLGAFSQTSLPGGIVLNIPENGVEKKLLAFINNPSTPANSDTWFDFDRLLFDTNSATLQPSSEEQLKNIANILKAYPNVHIRIGGYTDNQGDAAANLKLSQDRADNTMAALINLGVDPSRVDAKGYGEEHPVADNSMEAGRAQNRRISMQVTQK